VVINKPAPLMAVRTFVIFCILGILNTVSAQSSSSVIGSLSDSILDSEESSSLYSQIISKGLSARSENSTTMTLYPLTLGFSGTVLYEAIQYENDGSCGIDRLPVTMALDDYRLCINLDTVNLDTLKESIVLNGLISQICHSKHSTSTKRKDTYRITAERVAFENAIFEAIYSMRNTDFPQNMSPFCGAFRGKHKYYKYQSSLTLETGCKTLFKKDEESPSKKKLAYIERNEVIVLGKNAVQVKVTNKVQSISKWIRIMDADQVRYCQLANKYRDYELLSEELSRRSLKIKKFLYEFADEGWDNSSDYSNNFSTLVRKESSIEFIYKDKKYSYVHPIGKEKDALEKFLETINSFF